MSVSSIDAGAFRALTEAATDAIVISDLRDRILYANPAAHKAFGYPPNQLADTSLSLLMPERFREPHRRGMDRFVKTGVPHVIGKTVELAGLRRDGQEFPLELSLGAWNSPKGELCFIGIMRDITDRKAAELALHREVSLVQLLESVSASANTAENLEQAVSFSLAAICRELNWPLAHAYLVTRNGETSRLQPLNVWYDSGQSDFSAFKERSRNQEFLPGQGLPGRVLSTGEAAWITAFDEAAYIPRRDAARASGLKTAFAVPVLSGKEVVAVLEFFSTVSADPDQRSMEATSYTAAQLARVIERERAAAELRQLNAELERRVEERTRELEEARDAALDASRAKSAFLANMSHELRTPLNAILGYAELVRDMAETECSATISRDMNRILASGNHLLQLITDVLDLSKIEAGKMELQLESVSLRDIVSSALDLTRPAIEAAGNRIEVQCDEPISARADAVRLRQVLTNLLSNAGKFTRSGTVTISCKHASTHVEISVNDTGHGISAADLPRLFQKFEQLDSSTTRRHGGTGLGLVISRTMCRLMHGDLTVESQVGVGSTFTITLPPGET